jgi:hypothetical protein
MRALGRWWAWHRLERARWWSPRLLLAALAWLGALWWLVPRPGGGESRTPADALGQAQAAAAALRIGLALVPCVWMLYAQGRRIAAALREEAEGAAWPGAPGLRALARLSAASELALVWCLCASALSGLGLGSLDRRLFFDDPKLPALFEPGALARIELPAARGATALEVGLASLPRSSPEAVVELRLLDADGEPLSRLEQAVAGPRRLRLDIPVGSAPAELWLLRTGGGAGLRLEPPGLVWLGAAAPGALGPLALGLRASLALALLLALIEGLRRWIGSGLATATALLVWALWRPAWPLLGELGSSEFLRQTADLSQAAAPAWPAPAALLCLPLAALLAAGAASLGHSTALFREPRR